MMMTAFMYRHGMAWHESGYVSKQVNLVFLSCLHAVPWYIRIWSGLHHYACCVMSSLLFFFSFLLYSIFKGT